MAWLPRGEPARPLERRVPSEFVYPPFYELYQPSSLSWLPSGIWPLYPEVRKLGDFQQPPFQALYKPEGLQWLFEGQLSVRGIPYSLQGSWVVDPKPVGAVAFDPQFFPFQATSIVLARGLQTTIQSGYATPPLPPGPDVIPPAPVSAERFAGGWEYARRARKRLEEEIRAEREQWGILPKAAQVVSAVAIRQADALDLDAEQRLEELERELELAGVRYQSSYFELLNLQRQRLIDAEIKGYFEAQDALNEENKRRLMLLLAFL
jgi:hypothetical protein